MLNFLSFSPLLLAADDGHWYDFIVDFFDSLSSWLTNIWELIVNAHKNLVYLINIVYSTNRLSKFIIGYLPEVLASCLACVVVIAVLKLIFGRQS